jgi:hypothetical protein
VEVFLSQTSLLVRLSSLFFSFILITPNAIPAPRIGHHTQQATAVSAVTLHGALAALSPNIAISDVTLTGSVRRIAGSDDESGSATLKALSTGSARADLSLSSGPSSELQNVSAAQPSGNWSGPDGVAHPIPFHNLLSEPAWFFPAFAISRRLSTGYVVTDVGPETRNGRQVEHISVSLNTPSQFFAGPPTFQHLTQLDFYLDSVTFLPEAISFNIHPDNNALLDIPVEIDFTDYRPVSGVQIPFHIQKFLNNSLLLDFQVQSAAINSGLSASEFAIQ